AYALANLRSLQRRGAEAVALRVLASELGHSGRPRIVLGDFNDIANAVTTAIVMGAGAPCVAGMEMRARLYDANAIQLRQDALRHVGYTNIHDSAYMTIDHILVSEHFHPASPRAIGVLQEVTYLNDHLLLGLPHASDHGQVLARIKLLGNID
ncbi:MAG: endonuclease/exonuclease/phosphatase family protein, partial [Janthinobacterium sp.]